MSLWSNILFNCAVIINLIVAFFYPFDDSSGGNGNESGGQQRTRMISGEQLLQAYCEVFLKDSNMFTVVL